MKKSTKIILIGLVIMMMSVSAFARGKKSTITIAGSTTVLPIAQATAEVFMDKNPDINISVRGGGSSVGIASIISGTVDIGDASRHIKNKELTAARESGINIVEHIVANDGIAIVLNNSNPIDALTLSQLKDIYTGKIQNWKELGGKNMPIVVVSRDVSSGTFEVFNKLVLKNAKGLDSALMLASNNAVVTTISTTPGAIGYVGLGYVTDKIKAVSVDGVKATEKTIQTKEYPISRTLQMYTRGIPTGIVKQYIDFVLSPEGQDIVEQQGFIRIMDDKK